MQIKWKKLPVNKDGLKEFPVLMSKWLRGNGGGYLYDPETQKQCCLGCASSEIGIPLEMQIKKTLPYYTIQNFIERGVCIPDDYEGLGDLSKTDQIATINDKTDIDDEKRMQLLTELFAKMGYKPIFIKDTYDI